MCHICRSQRPHACHDSAHQEHEHGQGWNFPICTEATHDLQSLGCAAGVQQNSSHMNIYDFILCVVADLDRELEEAGDKTLVVVE